MLCLCVFVYLRVRYCSFTFTTIIWVALVIIFTFTQHFSACLFWLRSQHHSRQRFGFLVCLLVLGRFVSFLFLEGGFKRVKGMSVWGFFFLWGVVRQNKTKSRFLFLASSFGVVFAVVLQMLFRSFLQLSFACFFLARMLFACKFCLFVFFMRFRLVLVKPLACCFFSSQGLDLLFTSVCFVHWICCFPYAIKVLF